MDGNKNWKKFTFDYTNQIFRYEDNTTKIVSIWDQTIQEGNSPEGFFYGTEYTKEEIDRALALENPLQAVPTRDTNGHGTMLASIAAGRESADNDFIGAAPDAQLLVVKLKEAKPYLREFYGIAKEAIAYQENDIMMAVRYLDEKAQAERKPLVICIGVGTNMGDHNGNIPLAVYLSQVAIKNNRVVIAAAGNEANRRHHFSGTIEKPNEYQDVEIRVAEGERGFQMELWGNAPDIFTISIRSPGGEMVPRIPARVGETGEYRFVFERTVINIDYRIIEARTGDPLIIIRFRDPTPGIWNIRVYGNIVLNGKYNMWLPIEQFLSGDTYFLLSDPNTTTTDPSNALYLICVGAYDDRTGSIYIYSGRGFTRSGYTAPDFAAPGVGVSAVFPGNRYGQGTGTSVSAAIAAGAAALFAQWASENYKEEELNTILVKQYFIRGADRNDSLSYPNVIWGYGTLNLRNALASLITNQ